MLAATAAFRLEIEPAISAEFVGAMLARWHYIALAAPLILFAIELRRVRRLVLVMLFLAILLASAQALVDVRIRAIRDESPAAISYLRRDDPVRKLFGALHGASMMLLLLQTLAAAGVVSTRSSPPE